VALAFGLIASLALAACGEPGATATNPPGSSATYRNSEYHFAITYDPQVFNAAAELNRDAVPVGSPPKLDWSAWPVSMGGSKPDPASLPYTVGVSAADFKAQGMTSRDMAHDAAMTRDTARSHGGTYRVTALGGAKGYRAAWTDEAAQYRYVFYRLTDGSFTYTVAVVCRISDWPQMGGPLLATAESFRVQ
jgi:hypothetical protein